MKKIIQILLLISFFYPVLGQNKKPVKKIILPSEISETSGLCFFDNQLWTHNDDTDTNLYAIDTINGQIIRKIELKNTKNIDWEEITNDSTHIFVADFGNNSSGNRKDLKILKIVKNKIFEKNQKIDTISFFYPQQTNFLAQKSNTSNFDCEAFISLDDSLILFSKEWRNHQTRIYTLPKKKGKFAANLVDSIPISGLVTSAFYLKNKDLVVLLSYNKKLKASVYFIKNFSQFNKKKWIIKRIKLRPSFLQAEGICTFDGRFFYISNEKFEKKNLLKRPPALRVYDFSKELEF